MLSKNDFRPVIEKKLGTKLRCSIFSQHNKGGQPKKSNDYSKLASYANKPGIYHFTDDQGNSLYIGTAGYGKEQGLKERVTQHFTAKDTGGTFRDKVAEDKFKEYNPPQARELAVTWILEHTQLQLVVTPDEEHNDLEKLANEIFKPKYSYP